MTKNNLNHLKDIVIDILEKYPETRDNDDKLYVEVCKVKNNNILNRSFEEIMLHRKEYNVPSYASVERCRRKAQSEREDLVGTVREIRKSLEPEYIDFALN